jgi:hypothetical protein
MKETRMKKKTLTALLCFALASFAQGLAQGNEWVKYVSSDGGYSVLLPQKPETGSQRGSTPNSAGMMIHVAFAPEADGVFVITYGDIPSNLTYSFEQARAAMVASYNGKVIEEKEQKLGENPGREWKFEGTNAGIMTVFRVRAYMVGQRSFAVLHAFPKTSDNAATAAKTAKFFDSFKVGGGR